MQSAAGPSNCPLLISVNTSSESTAAVNVLMNVVYFKGSPLKEIKLNFGNFLILLHQVA